MVCGKCQKLSKSTTLATPGVKKKNDMYYGSPAGSSSSSKSGEKTKSATLGNNGVGKVRLSSHIGAMAC
jgi:cysteine-rich PDZ-binding protein